MAREITDAARYAISSAVDGGMGRIVNELERVALRFDLTDSEVKAALTDWSEVQDAWVEWTAAGIEEA